jgi:hypothetical protein
VVNRDIKSRYSESPGDIPHRVIHLIDFAKFEGRAGVWDMPPTPLEPQT